MNLHTHILNGRSGIRIYWVDFFKNVISGGTFIRDSRVGYSLYLFVFRLGWNKRRRNRGTVDMSPQFLQHHLFTSSNFVLKRLKEVGGKRQLVKGCGPSSTLQSVIAGAAPVRNVLSTREERAHYPFDSKVLRIEGNIFLRK